MNNYHISTWYIIFFLNTIYLISYNTIHPAWRYLRSSFFINWIYSRQKYDINILFMLNFVPDTFQKRYGAIQNYAWPNHNWWWIFNVFLYSFNALTLIGFISHWINTQTAELIVVNHLLQRERNWKMKFMTENDTLCELLCNDKICVIYFSLQFSILIFPLKAYFLHFCYQHRCLVQIPVIYYSKR